jgi:hypothetical protein
MQREGSDVAGFGAATTPRPSIDVDGDYDIELDPQWTVGGRPNGGYLVRVNPFPDRQS